MGQHSKPTPKKVSMFGSMAAIFVAMLFILVLFTTSKFVGSTPQPPVAHAPVPTQSSTSAPAMPATKSVAVTAVQVSGMSRPTQAPTISPTPKPSPVTPTLVPTSQPPNTPQGVDVTARVEVPLLGQVLETAGNLVINITEPLTDLLGH